MTRSSSRRRRVRLRALLGPAVLVAASTLMAAPGHAQFGGYGFGWGMMQFRPQSVEMLDANANIRASAAFAARQGQSLTDPGGRFAYRQQQIDLQNRYDFNSRQSFNTRLGRPANSRGTPTGIQGVASVPAQPSATSPPSQSAPAAPPSRPITAFLNAMSQVVWPADSPTEGDLGLKRKISDESTVVVARQFTQNGGASLTSIAEARKHLIDYGQPALQVIRQTSSPAVADTFHNFLLSLYRSLADSAKTSAPPIPAN